MTRIARKRQTLTAAWLGTRETSPISRLIARPYEVWTKAHSGASCGAVRLGPSRMGAPQDGQYQDQVAVARTSP
jgi:hypothetical protein